MTDEWLEDRALPEVYDINHPLYYCYLNCSEETLKDFLEHRELEYPKDASKEELTRILWDNDIDALNGVYKQPCDPNTCCPPTVEDDPGHFGCESCHPHYFYGMRDRVTYYLKCFVFNSGITLLWWSLGAVTALIGYWIWNN